MQNRPKPLNPAAIDNIVLFIALMCCALIYFLHTTVADKLDILKWAYIGFGSILAFLLIFRGLNVIRVSRKASTLSGLLAALIAGFSMYFWALKDFSEKAEDVAKITFVIAWILLLLCIIILRLRLKNSRKERKSW